MHDLCIKVYTYIRVTGLYACETEIAVSYFYGFPEFHPPNSACRETDAEGFAAPIAENNNDMTCTVMRTTPSCTSAADQTRLSELHNIAADDVPETDTRSGKMSHVDVELNLYIAYNTYNTSKYVFTVFYNNRVHSIARLFILIPVPYRRVPIDIFECCMREIRQTIGLH